MRPIVFVLALLSSASGCSHNDEHTSTIGQRIAVKYPANVFMPGFLAQEPHGAFANSRIFIGGANTGSGLGWFVATVAGTTITMTRSCSLSGIPLPCVAVPPGGFGAITPLPRWFSDPTVVADGNGNVVYVGLVDTNGVFDATGNGEDAVGAVVSTDLGQTFAGAAVVNNIATSPVDFFTPCATQPFIGGTLNDQPGAVFDYSTSPPTLWVVWRYRLGSISTYGLCIRPGVVDQTVAPATIHWLAPASVVQDVHTGSLFVGPGGVRVVAGDGVVTVAFASTADIKFCPNANLANLGWATIDSFDNGKRWIGSNYAYITGGFAWCVLGTPPIVGSGIREFDIARAPGGMEYMVVHDTRNTIRLFKSTAAGIGTGPDANPRTWYEWCPGTPTSNVLGGPKSNWLKPGLAFPFGCATPAFTGAGGSVVEPTIAVDGRGRLAITYYESNPVNIPTMGTPADTLMRVVFRGNLNPQDPTIGFDFVPVTAFFDPATATFGGRLLGDYMSIAVKPGSSGPRPGCTETSDFFPLWTQGGVLPSGGSVVGTTGVQLFP